MNSSLLADLLEFTRDGEWGKGEPGPGLVEMGVIRGTDFANIRRGDLSSIPVRYIPEKAALRKQLQANDILFETAGGTKDQPTGRSVFIPERLIKGSPRPLTCASFARFLRADTAKIEPRFLFWYLQYLWNERLIYQYHIQHTGVARFQYTQFASEQRVPYGDREEQVNIATTLAALDDKIELNRKTAATLEEMARALYRSWFVDFDPVRARAEGRAPAHMDAATAALFPDTFGKDGLPEGWSKAPLNTLCKITSGKRPSQKVLTENADNPIPVYGGNGISWFTNKKLFDDKFLVTGRVGTLGTVFRVQEACWVSDNALCLFPKNDAGFEYLFFALSQIDILSLNSGSTQPLLTQTSLAAQNCLLPNQRVILSFHEYVFPWFESQRHLVSQNRTLAILRDTLLPRLMSGELRVAAARELIEEVA